MFRITYVTPGSSLDSSRGMDPEIACRASQTGTALFGYRTPPLLIVRRTRETRRLRIQTRLHPSPNPIPSLIPNPNPNPNPSAPQLPPFSETVTTILPQRRNIVVIDHFSCRIPVHPQSTFHLIPALGRSSVHPWQYPTARDSSFGLRTSDFIRAARPTLVPSSFPSWSSRNRNRNRNRDPPFPASDRSTAGSVSIRGHPRLKFREFVQFA